MWGFRKSRLDWDLAVKFKREYGSDEKLRRLFLLRKTPRGIVSVDLKTPHTKEVLSSRIQKKTVAGLRKRVLFCGVDKMFTDVHRKKKIPDVLKAGNIFLTPASICFGDQNEVGSSFSQKNKKQKTDKKKKSLTLVRRVHRGDMMGTLSFNQITIHNRWPCKYLMRESHGENDSVLRNTHMQTHKDPPAQTAERQEQTSLTVVRGKK